MLNLLSSKFKEVALAVIPISILVIILSLTVVTLELDMFIRFLIGSTMVILGLGIFLFGAEIGITPIGNLMGETLARSNKVWVVGILGFFLGFFITIAEPDLQILAYQVRDASGGILSAYSILIVVSVGVGLMVAIGLLRILFGNPLNKTYTIVYLIIFVLGLIVSEEFWQFQ